jgi:type II secretory pathway pseudopilin PulG
MHTPKNNIKAFSLIEVVVAVGIFAIAIVSVIGLLVPISNSVVDVRDGDYAARLVTLAQSHIQRLPYDYVKNYLNNVPAEGSAETLYASMDGSKFGPASDAKIWNPQGNLTELQQNALRFFKIQLTRNDALSPKSNDDAAGYLAFNMTVTWTVYNPNGQGVATPQLSTMIIPCAITR